MPRSRIGRALVIAAFLTLAALGIANTVSSSAQQPARVAQQRVPARQHATEAQKRARQACPAGRTTKCRAALLRMYAAIEWQRAANLKLAREMVGNVAAWTCIHNGKKPNGQSVGSGEGSWTANTGNGYYGGLQMDRSFMRTYGADMIRRHHGGLADTWTPREQLIVAQRAYSQNRGYHPWPNTGRACGLL